MVRWFVDRLLASAVRRWPAQLREDLSREWDAELHALGQEHGVAAPVRALRQLRFAASLAATRPHSADSPLRGWLRPSPARVHMVWLLLAPAITLLSAAAALRVLLLIPFQSSKPILLILLPIGMHAVQAGLAALFGTLLGRRFLRRVGQPAGVAGCARATLPLIAGLLLIDVLARAADQGWAGSWLTIVAALCLAVLLPPIAVGAAALARRRRGLAAIAAGLAAPVLALGIAHLLVLLSPRPASATGSWWWLGYLGQPTMMVSYGGNRNELPIETALPILPGFVLTTAILALAHAIRLARLLPPAPARPATMPAGIPAVAQSPWWHRITLAAAAYCVLAWAVTLTYLTPNIGVQNSWPSQIGPDGTLLPAIPAGWPGWTTEEGRLWMHELQLSGIVCAALCLLFAAAYRGRPLLPVLGGSAVLLAVNMAVVRAGATNLRLLPWLAAGGLLLGVAVWWVATRNGPSAQHPHRPRRLVITITVLAALLVPGSFFPRFYIVPGVQAPPVLLAVAVGLPTILTLVAAMGVLATSARPRRGPAWLLPAGLALLPAVGGILYYQDGVLGFDPGEGLPTLLLFIAPLALSVPVVAWTIAAIRARPATPRRLALHVALTPLLLIVGYPVTMATLMAATIMARLLLFPMEYGRTYDGLVYVPGAIALGLLLGYLTARRLTAPVQ